MERLLELQIEKISAQTKTLIADLVEPFLKRKASGLGVVVGYAYANPLISSSHLYGNVHNQQQMALPRDANPRFQIASITKTMTATLYALSESTLSKLSPSPTLADIPGLKVGNQFGSIPLAKLVSYTSGLPADNDRVSDLPPYPPQPYTTSGMLGFLKFTPIAPVQVGERYTYSNLAFAIMGAVLQRVLGQPFEQLVKRRIFDRLKMDAIFFDDVFIDELPLGYVGPSFVPTTPGWPPLPAYNPAGGVVASGSDLMRWLLFNMGISKDRNLSPLLAKLHTPANKVKMSGEPERQVKTPNGDEVGLGWFVSSGPTSELKTIWKDGILDGFTSYIGFLQTRTGGQSACGTFVLANASGTEDPEKPEMVVQIGRNLLSEMLKIASL